ncbi:MAG: hypothetical protein WBX25_22415 [Rhodomicrobium sp.]
MCSSKNFEALEFARTLGIEVAINIIADPDLDPSIYKLEKMLGDHAMPATELPSYAGEKVLETRLKI